jgi:hypothetical protein
MALAATLFATPPCLLPLSGLVVTLNLLYFDNPEL